MPLPVLNAVLLLCLVTDTLFIDLEMFNILKNISAPVS